MIPVHVVQVRNIKNVVAEIPKIAGIRVEFRSCNRWLRNFQVQLIAFYRLCG